MSLVLQSSGGGSVTLQEPATASTRTLNLPDTNGTAVTTGDTGSVATAMIADSAVTPAKLSQKLTLDTAKASTSGTTVDFTDIPSWVTRIQVLFRGVSTSGTNAFLIQIGSGSVLTSGYVSIGTGGGAAGTSTAGFRMGSALTAANTENGIVTLVRQDGNSWVASGNVADAATVFTTNGQVTLSGALDRVRVTTIGGTDTFDAGSINILYE
jgi:hypothetical protein